MAIKPAKNKYTFNQESGMFSLKKTGNMKYVEATPIIKTPSIELIKLLCSSFEFVNNPMIEKTDIFINANDIPIQAKSIFVLKNELPKYI